MAIKITKRGVKPTPIPLKGRCSRCGCEFECDESDTLPSMLPPNSARYVKCPEGCDMPVVVRRGG